MTVRTAVIVAHPDDETIWAGGLILQNREWDWHVFTLCRAGDTDRAPKFLRALKLLNAKGNMLDLDDGPEQRPLDGNRVREAVLELLEGGTYDIVITHHPAGEYTRHLRHEEVSRAVISLWYTKGISARELWTFAYKDEKGTKYPAAVLSADLYYRLPADIQNMKNSIITDVYGFDRDSFEAHAAAQGEAFWQFRDPEKAVQWLEKASIRNDV
jgi:LmbE family N-acetylglucosaminyl deacetylase